MRLALTLVAAETDALPAARLRAIEAVGAGGGEVKTSLDLGPSAAELEVETAERTPLGRTLERVLADLPVDYALQPQGPRRRRLFLADMDSTIVGCECLDELADFAGVKAKVAKITERTMRGELDFETALRRRAALLKGLPLEALERCFEERVRLNPGARRLVSTLRRFGVRCVLVSGGFRPFTERVAALAGFEAERGNRFGVADGALTGEVEGPVLGQAGKLEALRQEAAALGAPVTQAVCIGDGANDLGMIVEAGFGVAYRAKPVLAAAADARIERTDLTSLLYFDGYREAEFSPA